MQYHTSKLWSLLALLQPLQVAADGSFFVLAGGPPLVSERIDPILAPGVVGSNHVHEIFGANKFSSNWDYKTAQTSTCNNMGPRIDHSNYWYPALYFKDGENYIKTKTDLTVYYHFDTTDNGPRKPFPDGFKMISGNAMLRHNDTLTDFSTRSIRWICHGAKNGNGPAEGVDNTGSLFESPGAFPTGFNSCPGVFGFSGEIWFPFCHNGQELDPKDPTAHMSFGVHTNADGTVNTENQSGGKCPESHPTPLPQLFMEFHHDTSDLPAWDADTNPFVLAPGDPTGYAMHADFINGWEKGFADQIAVDPNDPTKTVCYTGEAGADKCFEIEQGGDCSIEPELDEEVQTPGASLPGCNPIQPGPQDATIQTNCAGHKPPKGGPVQTGKPGTPVSDPPAESKDSTPSSTAAAKPVITKTAPVKQPEPKQPSGPGGSSSGSDSPSSNKIPSSVTAGGETWEYQGCYSDLVPDRSIRTLNEWGNGPTAQDCAASCVKMGKKISGVEYGSQCFCDDSMKQTKKLDDSDCNMPCKDPSQYCGGDGALQVYAKQGTNLGISKRSHARRHVRSFTNS